MINERTNTHTGAHLPLTEQFVHIKLKVLQKQQEIASLLSRSTAEGIQENSLRLPSNKLDEKKGTLLILVCDVGVLWSAY